MNEKKIQTFLINLPNRVDRKNNILNEFSGKTEFSINIVEPEYNVNPNVSLWETFKVIAERSIQEDFDYVLICEDDHIFTNFYQPDQLFKYIDEAMKRQSDVLLGGVSSFQSVFSVCNGLIWVERFTGTQFTILFKNFFNKIISANFGLYDSTDYTISDLSENKFFIFPFISVQKEFGYSDINPKNALSGNVTGLFAHASAAMHYLLDGEAFYFAPHFNIKSKHDPEEDTVISTFIINLKERPDRLNHIVSQFRDKPEFSISIIEACRHEIGTVGLWQSIRSIVEIALRDDEDLIIICEDDHCFTENYSKKKLWDNILEAHNQGADILSGGVSGGFSQAVPVAHDRFWVNHFYGTQFIVLYKKIFKKIIEYKYDDFVTTDNCLASLTSNKMVIYPFISTQIFFGYSDINPENQLLPNTLDNKFSVASKRLANIKKCFDKHI